VRRKFASELKEMPLRDLAHLGGWKNPQTVLAVYQQPSIELQRRGLATRKPLVASASMPSRTPPPNSEIAIIRRVDFLM